MSELPDTPFGVEEEGMAARGKPGRPRNKPPIGSILNTLKGIEDQLRETGEVDFPLARKLLAAYSAINLERALLAPDKEIPLKLKADWALRTGPVIAMLETLVPRDKTAYPKTEEALDSEIVDRQKRLLKLAGKGPVDAETILATMAPAAAKQPEEA
jgi:hypothetical protein